MRNIRPLFRSGYPTLPTIRPRSKPVHDPAPRLLQMLPHRLLRSGLILPFQALEQLPVLRRVRQVRVLSQHALHIIDQPPHDLRQPRIPRRPGDDQVKVPVQLVGFRSQFAARYTG